MYRFLVISLLLYNVHASLLCASRDDALSYVRQLCQQDAGMRLQLKNLDNAAFDDLVTSRLHLVRGFLDAQHAQVTNMSGDDDARHFFWPRPWREEPIITFIDGPMDMAVSSTMSECRDMSMDVASVRPPPEAYEFLYTLARYQADISDERICDVDNEVPVYDSSGDIHCGCAGGGHVCTSSTSTTATASSVLTTVLIVMLIVLVLGLAVFNAWIFSNMHAMRKKMSPYIPLDNEAVEMSEI